MIRAFQKRARRKGSSTFRKIAVSFLLLGVLPLLCVCLLFLSRYEQNARLSIESNMEEANYYAQSKVSALLSDLDREMSYLYDYAAGDFSALYAVLEAGNLRESERSMYVGLMLDEFLHTSPAISGAYFISARGAVYTRFYSQQKSLRQSPADHHRLPETDESRRRQLFLLPVAEEGDWCNGSTDRVLTLARNYMDTRSLKAVSSDTLGTLYLDVRTGALDELLSSIRLGAQGNVAIVDGESRSVLYSLHPQVAIPLPEAMAFQGGAYSTGTHAVFYENIGQSAYHLVVSFDRQELYSAYTSSRVFFFLVLLMAITLVLVLGLNLSTRLSKPARQLQLAMGQVQQGNLNTRVDIRTGDEMEYLAEGFNRMVEDLSDTIQEVYLAELCQRNAELNALKMQIQPHYLYNTLDVIRMNALECGDDKTARLIESLSRQLRYTMGDHRDRVHLQQELDSLREYAVLLSARYEGRIRIHIEAADSDLHLLVPKLLLQPFLENAVKHGLRDRAEGGSILVEAVRLPDCLQIAVYNDGQPIDPQRLGHIRRFLETAAVAEQDPANIVSVGMKNTYDRIKLNCGSAYGFTIDSDGSMGVVVTIRLPVWEEEEYVEGTSGG